MDKQEKCKIESISGSVVFDREPGPDLDIRPIYDEQDKRDDDDVDTLSTIERDGQLLFNEFLEVTTLHGIKYVYNEKFSRIRRFIWFAVMATSFGFLILTAKEQITKYTAKLTKEEYSTFRKAFIAFPAITICNSNPILKSRLDNPAVSQLFGSGSTTAPHWNDFVSHSNTTDVLEMYMDEFLMAHAPRASEMILQCHWKGGKNKCDAGNFTTTITSAGVCYTFNDGEFVEEEVDKDYDGHRVFNCGSRESLLVRLNAQFSNYVSTLSNEGVGFKILIHRRGDVPMVSDLGVAVMPGVRTLVAMTKHTERSMPLPYDTKCRKRPMESYNFYSEGACLTQNRKKRMAEACGCRLPEMRGSVPICTLRQFVQCESIPYDHHDYRCPPPCYNERFEIMMSYLKSPGEGATELLKNKFNWTKEDVETNVAELEVYFGDMNVFYKKAVPAYDLADLWGDLGGVIGVHLGASILTLVEFVDYFFVEQMHEIRYCSVFWRKIKAFCRRNKTDKDNETVKIN